MDKPVGAIGNIMWDPNRGASLNVWVMPDADSYLDEDGVLVMPSVERVVSVFKYVSEHPELTYAKADLPAPAQGAPAPAQSVSEGSQPMCPTHHGRPMKYFPADTSPSAPAWKKIPKWKCTAVVIPAEQSDNAKPVYCKESVAG